MAFGLFADFGQIHTAASRLDSGAGALLALTSVTDTSWLGSAAVGGALADSTRLRYARAQAVAEQLAVTATSVRDAVTNLATADAAAAQAVRSR